LKTFRDWLFGTESKGYMKIVPQLNPDSVIDVEMESKMKEEKKDNSVFDA